jgi:S-adenosyl-L-methionine hydrolase (adenosine-forming)
VNGNTPPGRPVVTFLTDYGTADTFAGQMKGVVLSRAPDSALVDLTHAIPPQSIAAGALSLSTAWRWFPEGTIHVAVVDPGVGTERRPIACRFEGHFFIGPDNGLLSGAFGDRMVDEAVQIELPGMSQQPVSQTFHGRDVFAVAAGMIAAGSDLNDLGPTIEPESLVRLSFPAPDITEGVITGEIIQIDHFGNAITNIGASILPAGSGPITIRCGEISLGEIVEAYAAVEPGMPLALFSSMATLELAIRDGSAAERYDLHKGMVVTVEIDAEP